MICRQVRNASRRITIELLVVATLSGFGPDFPSGASGSRAWTFVAHHPTELLHVLGGLLVLAESVVLSIRLFTASARVLVRTAATIGACGGVLACGSGIWFVTGRQPEDALLSMTVGWLLALATQIWLWVASHRQLRQEGRVVVAGH